MKSTLKRSEKLAGAWKPEIIKTKSQYKAAMARVEQIFASKPGTPAGNELELLLLLVEKYEEDAFPISRPHPVAAIRFRMDQQDLKPKDLVPLLGSKSKVSEVLSGRRPLSLAMIRNLVAELSIPADILLQETPIDVREKHPRQS